MRYEIISLDMLNQDDSKYKVLYSGGLFSGYIIYKKNGKLFKEKAKRDIENYFNTNQDFDSPAVEENSSVILVVEPGAELEINVTRFLRIGLGGSYRIVENVDITDVSNKSLSGFSGNFSLKFGSFR